MINNVTEDVGYQAKSYGTASQTLKEHATNQVQSTGKNIPTNEERKQESNNQENMNSNGEQGCQITEEEKQKAMDLLKKQFKNTKLEISYNDDVNRFAISVIDSETQKVVKEIPSEETLKMLESTMELVGMLVDEKR